jgi:hypothetical protein
MVDRRVKRGPVGALAIGALSLLVSACRSPGGAPPPAPWVRRADSDSTNVTMRPIFDPERRRTFFIGGYAGANYAPELFGRRASVVPPGSATSGPPIVTVEPGALEPD